MYIISFKWFNKSRTKLSTYAIFPHVAISPNFMDSNMTNCDKQMKTSRYISGHFTVWESNHSYSIARIWALGNPSQHSGSKVIMLKQSSIKRTSYATNQFHNNCIRVYIYISSVTCPIILLPSHKENCKSNKYPLT